MHLTEQRKVTGKMHIPPPCMPPAMHATLLPCSPRTTDAPCHIYLPAFLPPAKHVPCHAHPHTYLPAMHALPAMHVPPQTDRHLLKNNLRKLRLRAIISSICSKELSKKVPVGCIPITSVTVTGCVEGVYASSFNTHPLHHTPLQHTPFTTPLSPHIPFTTPLPSPHPLHHTPLPKCMLGYTHTHTHLCKQNG